MLAALLIALTPYTNPLAKEPETASACEEQLLDEVDFYQGQGFTLYKGGEDREGNMVAVISKGKEVIALMCRGEQFIKHQVVK